MDPFRNLALQNSKVQTLLQDQQRLPQTTTSGSDMPPPPAYHTVVDPTTPLPNMHNPYDADDEEKEDDDTPEINVNAMTQVRGHGNIISIAQMDSVRIANLIVALLNGAVPPSPTVSSSQETDAGQQVPQASQAEAAGSSGAHRTQSESQRPRAWRRDARHMPKVNVTVNCGATVIGDRNIVGPGLGDIARHIQMAQRNQMVQQQQMAQQQQQQKQQQQQMNANRPTAIPIPNSGLGFSVGGHAHMTPPMSRSSSFGSQGSNGLKRKTEDGVEDNSAKRRC